MCRRRGSDLFTDFEFLMKFILFWVIIITQLIRAIVHKGLMIPLPATDNMFEIELTFGLYNATIGGTILMCVNMMIVLGLDSEIYFVANIMLPIYAVMNFISGIVFSVIVSKTSNEISYVLVPVFFFIYFLIILIDIILSYLFGGETHVIYE